MLSKELIKQCQVKLLKTKDDLLNQAQTTHNNMNFSEGRIGDEADQTVRMIEEKNFLQRNNRIRLQLMEVEQALARIEQGCFFMCISFV